MTNIKKVKNYKTWIMSFTLLLIVTIYNYKLGIGSVVQATSQFAMMLKIVPPIFLMIGLLDVWVPREVMIKLMGERSGILGITIAFLFGTFAAGPLVGAFPVAMIMLKKGARYANVLFFLMIWASAKLPIIFFQATTLGLKFTIVSNITLVIVYLIGSFVVEKLFTKQEMAAIYEKAENYQN